jgi:hypothetical protein
MDIKEISQWFGAAVPTPSKDNQRVQLAIHFEEVSEMLDELSSDTNSDIIECNNKTKQLSNELKRNPAFELAINDRKALLDALCDQIVTAVGVAHMFGFDIGGALDNVNSSNWSKFTDTTPPMPIFNEQGKIIKGPNYRAPDLTPFLGTDPTA